MKYNIIDIINNTLTINEIKIIINKKIYNIIELLENDQTNE